MRETKKPKIRFFSNDIDFRVRNSSKLKSFIQSIFKEERKSIGSINYIFCSDDYLLKINNDYLDHDYYTDIITFNISEKAGYPIVGEIFISIDRIKENAKNLGVTTQSELHRVIFHGALHLCGYNDSTSSQIKQMRKKEDKYLSKYLG